MDVVKTEVLKKASKISFSSIKIARIEEEYKYYTNDLVGTGILILILDLISYTASDTT